MKPRICLALAVALAFQASAQQASQTHPASSDNAAAIAFVQGFFTAFDARDYAAMEHMFLPTAKLVHSDGVEEDVPTMLSTVRSAENWRPRKRDISHCETTWIGDAVVVGCLNHVWTWSTAWKRVSATPRTSARPSLVTAASFH